MLRDKGNQNDQKAAKQLYKESIEEMQPELDKNNNSNSLKFSSTLLNYGILCEKLDDLQMEEVYSIRKKLSPMHNRSIAVLEPLANIYLQRSQYDKAIESLKIAITISKVYYGNNHKKTIDL